MEQRFMCPGAMSARFSGGNDMHVASEGSKRVSAEEHLSLQSDQQSDAQRVPKVVGELSELVFRETPAVAISSLVSVLSGVLLVVGADPVKEAKQVAEAVQGLVRQHVDELSRGQTSSPGPSRV
jgi:hypothetical protein